MPYKYSRSFRPLIEVIGPSIAYVPLTQGQYALVDSWRVDELQTNWQALWNPTSCKFYAARKRSGNRTEWMHRILFGECDRWIIDHKNANSLDNRGCNLRLASHAQNAANRIKKRTGKEKLKGISFDVKRKLYKAEITVSGRRLYLGFYQTDVEAHHAYAEAAKRHHGDYARV